MQDDRRASQFAPFDALNGFREALREVDRLHDEKIILSSESLFDLDFKIKSLNKGDKVLIKYYLDLDYVEVIGSLKKIDYIYKKIYLDRVCIDIDNILNIDKID